MGEIMSKVKVQVQLTESALREFKAIQAHQNRQVSEWGLNYLKKLVELPPKSWQTVGHLWHRGIFKVNDFIPFDIRGKVEYGTNPKELVILITRFKLKQAHSRIWFEKINAEEILGRTVGFN